MGGIFSFIKKTSFYRFYNYDDSLFDSDEESIEIPYYTENLYDSNYNTYTGYSQKTSSFPYYSQINSENLYEHVVEIEEEIGVSYKIKD